MALHSAYQAIRSGECPAAIVGGINVLLKPNTSVQFMKLGMLSPEGTCKSFDDSGRHSRKAQVGVSLATLSADHWSLRGRQGSGTRQLSFRASPALCQPIPASPPQSSHLWSRCPLWSLAGPGLTSSATLPQETGTAARRLWWQFC